MHAVDPLQRLRLLRHRLEQTSAERLPPEIEFHREITEIFTGLRDLHTNYFLPAPFAGKAAFLPFMVEDYEEGGQRRYLVSHVASGFSHATFKAGVEVIHWNGAPIDRAVSANGQRFYGSNLEARHARGVATLTTRPLIRTLPPDEDWVVGFRTEAGEVEELRFDWMASGPLPSAGGAAAARAAAAMGIDVEIEMMHRARLPLFAPETARAADEARKQPAAAVGLVSNMPAVFQARPVDTPHGRFAYVRIRSFGVEDAGPFVQEFIRLLALLPQNGLIIDVRGNGGGLIYAGEQLLQVLTPRRIEPARVQFVSTPMNLRLCRLNGPGALIVDLSPWEPSLAQALETGAAFSTEDCNRIGQRYHGPVVLVTDALCYSTTDIFAAGFQDHEIGPILGTDRNTGAGGANVWDHALLRQLIAEDGSSVPYEALPKGAGLSVAIRRTLRVGKRAGTPLEDLGVVPDHHHPMTRVDLLEGNVDLIAKAASLVAPLPVRQLTVQSAPAAGDTVEVTVTTQRLDRLDAYVNGRPIRTVDIGATPTGFTIARPPMGAELRLHGYEGGQLVASRVEQI